MSLVNVSNGIVEPRGEDHCDIIIESVLKNCDWLKVMLAKLIDLEEDLEESKLHKYCANLIRKYQKSVLEKYGKTGARAKTKGAFAVNLQEMTLRLYFLVQANSLDEAQYLHYFARLYRLYLEIAFNATLPGIRNIKKEEHLFNILEYGRNLFFKYPDRILDAFLTATLEPQDRIDMLYFAMTFPHLFASSHETFYKFLVVARVLQYYYHSERANPEVRDKLTKVCKSVISTQSKITLQFMDFLRIKRPSKIAPGLQMTPVDIVNSLNSKRGIKEAEDSIYQIPEVEGKVVFSIDRSRDEVQSSSGVREIVFDMKWNDALEPELQEVKNGEGKLEEVEGDSREDEDMFADVVERPPEDPKDDNVDVATAPIPSVLESEEESDIEVIGECFINPPEGANEEASEPEGSYDSSENPPNYDEDSSNSDSEEDEEEQEENEESSEEEAEESSEEEDKSEKEEPEGNGEVGDKSENSEKDEVDSDDDIEKVKAFSPMKMIPSPTQAGGSQDRAIEGIVSKFTEAIAKSNIPREVEEPSPPKERELRTRAAPKGVQPPKIKQQPAPKVKEPLPKVIQPRPTSSMLSTLVPAKREAPALRTRRNTAANKFEEEVKMKKDEEIPAKKGKMTRKKAEPATKAAPIAKSEQNMIAPPKMTALKLATPKNASPAKGLATKEARGKPKKNEVKKTTKSSTKAEEEAPKPEEESTAPTKGPATENKEEVPSTSKGRGKGKKGKNDAPESATITTRSLRSSAARMGSIARLT